MSGAEANHPPMFRVTGPEFFWEGDRLGECPLAEDVNLAPSGVFWKEGQQYTVKIWDGSKYALYAQAGVAPIEATWDGWLFPASSEE